MRTIIAGSRDGVTRHHLDRAMLEFERLGHEVTTVISGCARGADTLGEEWAARNNIPVEKFPADWNLHGRCAGYFRNNRMADNAQALIALWDGTSKGTKHMVDIAREKGLVVLVYRFSKE